VSSVSETDEADTMPQWCHTWRMSIGSAILAAACLSISVPAAGRELIERKETTYSNVYVFADGKYRYLDFRQSHSNYIESAFNTEDYLELPVEYTRYMTVGLAYAGSVGTIIEIGFGGGRTVSYLHKQMPEASMIAVELDPAVVALAKKYFGVAENETFHIVVQDGRRYLADNAVQADVIMLDAYRGDFVPFHLLTREFYSLVKRSLAKGGVVVQNVEPTTMLFDASVATIKSVFDNVEAFETADNIVVVAYDGPAKTAEELRGRAAALQARYRFRYPMSDLIRARKDGPALEAMISPNFVPLVDDFAPVDTLRSIARHNRK
jgi:spermidine synthase